MMRFRLSTVILRINRETVLMTVSGPTMEKLTERDGENIIISVIRLRSNHGQCEVGEEYSMHNAEKKCIKLLVKNLEIKEHF